MSSCNFRKYIQRSDLDFLIQNLNFKSDQKKQLFDQLFEFDIPEYVYLKSSIRSDDELREIIDQLDILKDAKSAIKNKFFIESDLHIENSLKNILLNNSSKIALFIGAGVSKLLGIPLWSELASRSVDYLYKEKYLNYIEAEKLKQESGPKQILTIFDRIIDSKDEKEKFYRDNLKVDEEKKILSDNPYQLFLKLEKVCANSFLKITTNLDKEWENTFSFFFKENKDERNSNLQEIPVITQKDLSGDTELSESKLYKIHGTIDDLPHAVLTTKDYVKVYSSDGGLREFLEKVFQAYHVIFIGTSMQEMEILDPFLKSKDEELKHFSVQGMFLSEEHLFRIKSEYFKELNTTAIPFYLDFEEYKRMVRILNYWIKEIKTHKDNEFYKNIRLIDEVCDDN